jgi:two-component system, chemotaxis family, protein-glutamate methylesterase/glutaminase
MQNRFNKRKIRVLVADGSAFEGMQIAKILDEDDRIEVVGRAKDGDATLHMVEDLSPDVITLDVDMPGMDGTAILKHIMVRHSVPTLMVCSLTPEQSRLAFDALRYGAIDVLSKPSFEGTDSLEAWKASITSKVKRAASIGADRCRCTGISSSKPKSKKRTLGSPDSLTRFIGIGAGPEAYHSLIRIIPNLSSDFQEVLIAKFVDSAPYPEGMAFYLDEHSSIRVRNCREASALEKGTCYVCGPHDRVLLDRDSEGHVRLILEEAPGTTNGMGEVDRMFQSLAGVAGKKATGIIMSGPGSDGVKGIAEIKKAGGNTVIQETSGCLDPSMPRAVLAGGNVDLAMPDFLMPDFLMNPSTEDEYENVVREISGYEGSTAIGERESFCCFVERVDIITFLQFVLLTGKPMVIEMLSSSGEQGRIFLRNGNILQAICGNLEGERALFKCLGFRGGRFSNRPWREPARETIGKSSESLLAEAARKRDEGRPTLRGLGRTLVGRHLPLRPE